MVGVVVYRSPLFSPQYHATVMAPPCITKVRSQSEALAAMPGMTPEKKQAIGDDTNFLLRRNFLPSQILIRHHTSAWDAVTLIAKI